jgi:hypothetical protein
MVVAGIQSYSMSDSRSPSVAQTQAFFASVESGLISVAVGGRIRFTFVRDGYLTTAR